MHFFKDLIILFHVLLIVSVTTAALTKLNVVDTAASPEVRAKSLCRICAAEVVTCTRAAKDNPAKSPHDCWVAQCRENPKMCGACESCKDLGIGSRGLGEEMDSVTVDKEA
ncbi:hypothetical protein HBH74_136860 [Parastagonospora nodorum]|nr:hypothetical protein HBH46_155160 [Parastagonospora nodorum]KAH4918488.1 hypothetical protein HBH74_136860 [Parastagonospora nodorum]KAH4937001.1 hypothetical protein HBH73_167690 [Parastagonospora nodorum]KAH6013118.1 hypothetical protein HBI83_153110 [Parastagonospora nodorum]KAH6075060.1 hypothetical protein HBI66_104170 [Parastagonospora nodorum]